MMVADVWTVTILNLGQNAGIVVGDGSVWTVADAGVVVDVKAFVADYAGILAAGPTHHAVYNIGFAEGQS